MKPADNNSNMQNKNKGTAGTNKQYDKNQGNRGKQLNPNNKKNSRSQHSRFPCRKFRAAEGTAKKPQSGGSVKRFRRFLVFASTNIIPTYSEYG